MKTFFKLDFYLQFVAVFFTGIVTIIYLILDKGNALSYYFIVGGFQLISFLIRIYLPYPKNIFYHLYGGLILPVWLAFLFGLLEIKFFSFLFGFAYLSVFYAPVLSFAYLFYCYQTYKNHEKLTPQNFSF